MDQQHPHRHGARAARSHGTVETEHGATATDDTRAAPRHARPASLADRIPSTVWAPLLAALAFGCFTIFRTHTAGEKGGSALLYGVAGAVVTGILGLIVVHFQSSMLSETRAVAYGALFGLAMGWVYSLGGEMIAKSVGFGLLMGAVMFVASLYLFRGRRASEPHGRHRPHKGERSRQLPVATH
ncbi:hypothetical protein [Streptomyces sp. NPDC020742]|uniref:hypothetical protein n=1 Tax=Streptomyces sp. NPDC020742 TaxID=3154897 RepID=UPI0033FA39C5